LVCEIKYFIFQEINDEFIGQYTIEQIQAQPNGSPSKIKVKVRVNRSGIFDVAHASIVDPADDLAGKRFPQKNIKSKDFLTDESLDTKVRTEHSTEQNIPETMEEVNSILSLIFRI
jgi:molecular chaperone DnaK (HSP70)